jgi:hypothetical protein
VRALLAVLLVVLCACESRNGVYFNVDGDGNGIKFDRVQLYFGKNGQTTDIGRPSGATMGKAYEHDIDASDSFTVEPNADGSLASETTYWLPINDHNAKLDYVAAIVYDSTSTTRDKPVGVGELSGFKLEDGIVNKYDIELEKADVGVDVWGSNQSCFAWTRFREGQFSTIAVLSPDDLDCDGVVAGTDCNDLCPIGSTLCSPDLSVCGTDMTCGLGCARTGDACQIQTCLPDIACSADCVLKGPSLDTRMDCAAKNIAPHLTVNVNMTSGTPCARVFTVPIYNRSCAGVVELWEQNFFDGWSIEVKPSANDPNHCEVSMNHLNPTASFSGDHHVLVAFPPISPSQSQWSVMLGVRPGTTPCGIEGYTIDQLIGMPNDCP